MKRMLVSALAAAALAGCASMSEPSATAPSKEMKMAFDVTDTATAPLIVKLETIETTRKQLIEAGYTPRIVVTLRGNASYFTQTDMSLVKEADRADALKIQAKNLMPEVKLVPNGWIALAEYQHKGYAYIAP